MTHASVAERLEASVRRAFEELATDLCAAAHAVRVRVAPIDVQARFAFPEEELLVANAVDARRREFATARRIAHELLDEMGVARGQLLSGERRAPAWPAGVVGTISHARGVAAVALAPAPPIAAIGLDVEGADALSPELVDTVLTAVEKERFARADGDLGTWAKLAFCAKESAYKSWSPTLDAIPEFSDVEIEFGPDRTSFVARLIPRRGTDFAARALRGRYARCDEHVYAATLDTRPGCVGTVPGTTTSHSSPYRAGGAGAMGAPGRRNRQEVRIQTRGPDAGNPPPR
jgi:4'-phosphopantetheinyl transferase EntD